MRLVVIPEAATGVNDAASWYEGKRNGLGKEFPEELGTAFERIEFNPEGQPLIESEESSAIQVRHCLLKRFPYLVIFAIRSDEILILALTHAHRKPGY